MINWIRHAALLGFVVIFMTAVAASAQTQPASDYRQELLHQLGGRNVRVHDPSAIIKCKDEYWIFYTGVGTPSIHSTDLVNWSAGPHTFAAPPAWVKQAVPANRGDLWAPDVIQIGNRYLLFVSASSFGKNTSAIGVATNTTLDPADPAYHWSDGGIVVRSREDDDFNCIDPCAFRDADGRLWLSFGSFWSGIKLIELDPITGRRISPDSPMYNLAHWDAIEASYLYHHDQYYYLFASFGMCCRGVNSTYNTRVGAPIKSPALIWTRMERTCFLAAARSLPLRMGQWSDRARPASFRRTAHHGSVATSITPPRTGPASFPSVLSHGAKMGGRCLASSMRTNK